MCSNYQSVLIWYWNAEKGQIDVWEMRLQLWSSRIERVTLSRRVLRTLHISSIDRCRDRQLHKKTGR